MKRITITSRMAWTEGGVGGAFLFVIAPLVGGFAWSWYLSTTADRYARSAAAEVATLVMFVSALTWLIGILLVFYGRTYTHHVEISEESGSTAAEPPAPLAAPVVPPTGENGPAYRPGMRRW